MKNDITSDAGMRKLKSENDSLETEIKDLTWRLSEMENKFKATQEELEKVKEENEEYKKREEDLYEAHRRSQEHLSEMSCEMKKQEQEINNLTKKLDENKIAYENGTKDEGEDDQEDTGIEDDQDDPDMEEDQDDPNMETIIIRQDDMDVEVDKN